MDRFMALVAFILLVTACGAGDSATDATLDVDQTTTPTSAVTTNPSVSSASQSGDGEDSSETPPEVSGIGQGTATINGETYLFGDAGFPALQCEPDMFGIFFVFLQQIDESGAEVSGGSLQLTLLLEGTDPAVVGQDNEAHLRVDDQDWIADPEDIADRELDPGTSQVDSYTVTGNSVSGTATYYEEESYFVTTGGSSDPVVTAQGSFEVTCAGE